MFICFVKILLFGYGYDVIDVILSDDNDGGMLKSVSLSCKIFGFS